MIFWSILGIFFFSLLLVKAADHVVIAVRRLSGTGGGMFAVSAIILAIGTSFPELSVALTSSLSGISVVSLGDTLGSNIVNMSLVAGVSALIVGSVHFGGTYLKKDMLAGLLAGILPFFLMLDSRLTRVDGIILLLLYAAYAFSFFRERIDQLAKEQSEESFVYRFLRKFNHVSSSKRREVGRLLLAVAVMLFAADIVVRLANFIALRAGIPPLVAGLIFVALGTSLPELAFSFRSLSDHEPSMFVGNLVGSTVANSTLVIGLAATISPIEGIAFDKYLTAVVAFVVIYVSFWFMTKSKLRLDRWESLLMVALYVVFLILEFT